MGLLKFFVKSKREYYLENAEKLNQQNPRTFLIPTPKEVNKIEIGALVKLIFAMEKSQKNGCHAERMLVEVTEKPGNFFVGRLYNEPHYLKTIKFGDVITFGSENIAGTEGGKPPFDENLFAIITKESLDNRQVNYAVKSDQLDYKQDSGWQLFYGDETDKYLENPDNASIISLEQVLAFEPLLESVFCGTGNSYEYSASENMFIEIKE